MTYRPRRAARRWPLPRPAPLPLLALLLLLPAAAPPRLTLAAKPRAPPAFVFGRPLAPFAPDSQFESLLALAQVPALDPDASSSSSASTSQQKHQQLDPQIDSDQQQQHQPAPPPPLRDEDFVFATGTCRERMHLAKSTRAWRRGIRAFMLTDQDQPEALARLNAEGAGGGGGGGGDGGGGGGDGGGGGGPPHNEAFAFFPDDGAAALGGVAHGTKQGDTRAAVAPFAAHRHFGETYKWMLYGDDDTLFYMDSVKRMLAAFDPDLPLAFSDNLWYFGEQPNAHAPRCLPCHMANDTSWLPTLPELAQTASVRDHLRKWLLMRSSNVTEADVDELVQEASEVPGRLFVPRPACPYCTPEKACNRDTDPPNKAPCNPSVAHGGAGMIFSVGLLRSLPYTDALACIRSFRAATGGDALVSNCLWRHGIAFTDPGPLVRHAYDPHYHVFGGGKSGQGYLWDPIGMMTHGRCNAKCRWMLRNTLSLHLKGRHFRSWRVGSVLMWGIAHASQAAHSFLELASRDGGVSWKQLPYGFDVDDAAGFAPYMALAAPPTPARSASSSSRSTVRAASAADDGGEA